MLGSGRRRAEQVVLAMFDAAVELKVMVPEAIWPAGAARRRDTSLVGTAWISAYHWLGVRGLQEIDLQGVLAAQGVRNRDLHGEVGLDAACRSSGCRRSCCW